MSKDTYEDNKAAPLNGEVMDDEEFIQSLYDDLTLESDVLTNQPSDELDRRILSAAHKAVDAKPSMVNQPITKEPSNVSQVVKKKSTWYLSLASAASFILVVSLFSNQMSEPFVQNEMSFNKSELSPIVHHDDKKLSEPLTLASLSKPSQSTSELQNESITKESMERNKRQREEKHKSSKMKVSAFNQEKYRVENEKKLAKVTSNLDLMRESSNALKGQQKFQWLTHDKFEYFNQIAVQWSFIGETDTYYEIKIHNMQESKEFFYLNKEVYFIKNTLPTSNSTEQLREFFDIKLITRK